MKDKTPFLSARERFYSQRNLMKGLVVRYILRYTRRILSDSRQADMRWPTIDEVALATGVSDIDIAGTTWLSEHKFPMLSGVEHSLADFQRALDDRIAATDALDHLEYLTPERISGEFQLNDMEIVLLCAIAAPQTDNDILRLYQFATGMDSTLFPGFFYAELLANENYAPDDILTLLTPTHPLRLYSLIEAGAHSEWGKSTPPSLAPLSVPNRIISFLLGSDSGVDMDYARCIPATPAPAADAPETADDAPPDQNPLVFEGDFERQTVKRLKHRKARILFIGPKGFGRRSFIQKYAAQSHVSAIEINLSKISGDETPHHLMTTAGLWFREARLQQAIMIFRCDEAPDAEAETVMLKIASKFRDMADRYPGTICLLAQARLPLFAQWFGDCAEVLCPLPARASQMHMWQTALKPYAAPNRIDKIAAYVSTSYRLTMGEIKQTIAACRAQNAGKAINGPQLAETLRLTRGQELIGLAELKATPLGLSDIVLSEKVSSVIGEILNYARYSEFVSDEWGFSKMSRATGLSVLFAAPGTGKTLTAGVLAHELKRAFYVVDISRVVDKYIGETEKMAKIFDHAQKSQAILLFDEADSLFAKRTAVKSSNDRYANLEINYLLQRLEAYPGMTILTTNHADSLDEALARRIQFKVTFDIPSQSERADLWRILLPEAARDPEIDFDRLGEGFEMSGGHIKNATFRACIRAASLGTTVTTDMLWDAAVLEFRSMGHVIRDDIDLDEA